MMKRTLLLALALLLAALFVLSACDDNLGPGSDTTSDPSTTVDESTDTQKPVPGPSVAEKYIVDANKLVRTPGTFTDRLTAEQFGTAFNRGGGFTADPLLYNIVSVMGLTREDLTLYSEMNGGLLSTEQIDALFLEPAAMREALRAPYTIMAGGYPYTVFDLTYMPEADRAALGIPAADLAAFLSTIPAAAEAAGETLENDVLLFIEANTAK